MSRPFSQQHVINETLKHQDRVIAISVKKTLARMAEFQGDKETTTEIVRTLHSLNELSRLIQSVRDNNNEILGE